MKSCTWGRITPDTRSKLEDDHLEDIIAEKELGIMVDIKLNMSQQYTLTTKAANDILGCIRQSTASRSREGIRPLCSASVRPPSECCVQFLACLYKANTDVLRQSSEGPQRRSRDWSISCMRRG